MFKYFSVNLAQLFSIQAGLYCHRWPVRAVERYAGPWDKKLSNTILVIGMSLLFARVDIA